MSKSHEPLAATSSEDVEPESLPDRYLDPHEWLSSLDLRVGMTIRPSPSLHADYREATFNGFNHGSAIAGGRSPGFWYFDEGPHDWKQEDINRPRNAFSALHLNLNHNLRISSIEQHRVTQLLKMLRYDFLSLLPETDRPNYTPKMIEGLEDTLLLMRDHKESLPFDETTQTVFDEDIVMMLCLVYNHSLGYLPTFQRKGVASPPGRKAQEQKKTKKSTMIRQLCVLENKFTRLMNIAFVKYPLQYFIRWASYEPVDTASSLAVGSVISAHLFRGRRGIEHEFVLISFGKDGVPASWLRAERAARAKTSLVQPQWDSFGPLFTGVTPLDTISFSVNKGDLVSSRDVELATLFFDASRRGPVSGMYVREVSEHFAATVTDSPDYVLWSTNCRFFARKTLINVAVRFGLSHPSEVKLLWGGQIVDSLEGFLARLQAERFGGSALVGNQAAVARVKTLIYIASAGGPEHMNALQAINEALAIVDSFPDVLEGLPANLKWLRSDCYAEKSRALDGLGLYEEAYQVSRIAVDLVAPNSGDVFDKEEDPFWETGQWSHYGRALRMMTLAALRTDRIPEAVNKSLECLAVHRPSVLFGKGALFLERAISNAQIFAAASLTTSVEVAIAIAHKAEGIFRYLYKLRPDAVAFPFAEYLHSVANFHFRYFRPKLALAASSECIQLYREVPFIAERYGLTLARAIADHAQFAAELREWEESISAEETALAHLQMLNGANPHVHDHRIFRSMMHLRDRTKMMGDSMGALKWSRELENFTRALLDHNAVAFADASLELLADATYHHGVDASAAEIWDEAEGAFRRSIEIHEERGEDLGLAYAYLELSKCISNSYRNPDEAVDFSRRAVDMMRVVLDHRPHATSMPLASALSNLAWIQFLFVPDVLSSVIAEEECLLVRDEMASAASDDHPLCDIDPEPTVQLVASLARLHIYLAHAGRDNDAAAAMDRMNLTLEATVHNIAGVAESVRTGLIPRLKDEGTKLQARGRSSDAQLCSRVIDALDSVTVEVDVQELAQRAERARLSRRIMERDDAEVQPEDEALMTNALSTMTLDDGQMGLKHGKVLDDFSGFSHHSW